MTTIKEKLNWSWVKAFEAAVILGGFSAAFIVGVAAVWISDTTPLFEENPDPASHYIQNPQIHAGDLILTVRSVRRTDDCPLDAGVWLATAKGEIVMPIQTYVSFSDPSHEWRKQKVWFVIPEQVPPGHYVMRTYVTCQKNPLRQVGQKLKPDLPFEVLPPEVPR